MLKSPTASYHRHKRLHTKNADSVKNNRDSVNGRRLEARFRRGGVEEGLLIIERDAR
jgi:hypothetical protein